MPQTPIHLSLEGPVAIVALDRPEALNAIDPAASAALSQAWARIAADPDIRVAILTGAGEKSFCVGADLKKTLNTQGPYAAQAFSDMPEASFLPDLEKPLIAAINGLALGGGLELALACDIRLAASHAKFGLPEVKAGTIPGAGGTQRLPRMIGASDAMLMLLTGDMIDAPEALRVGLISRIAPSHQLLQDAKALALKIAANAPLSIRAVKRLTQSGRDLPLREALRLERLTWGMLRDTEDRREGRLAFAEKRPPMFKGR
ncbi:MAG: enoyl-CoA hydratase/isomerase family protein [Proteobacteria bacterium]|nr:enoyl-CoA hydratase/isomerase family protein [Pseudomonadota bacterium]